MCGLQLRSDARFPASESAARVCHLLAASQAETVDSSAHPPHTDQMANPSQLQRHCVKKKKFKLEEEEFVD